MIRIVKTLKWSVLGLLSLLAIGLWICLSLVPLNLALGEKMFGRRCVENVSAEELYRYLPESRQIVPPTAIHIHYQSHWLKGHHLEGSHLVRYELNEADFHHAVQTSANLVPITSPMTFEEIDTLVSEGAYRRDQRKDSLELIVFDRNRKQVWYYRSRS